MDVILLENVKKVGDKFETVSVKRGFALNFLIPQNLARPATDAFLSSIQEEKERHQKEEGVREQEILKTIETLEDGIVIKAKANEQGHLFAGISPDDILEALQEQKNIYLRDRNIDMSHGIKAVGDHKIPLMVAGTETKLTVTVEAE